MTKEIIEPILDKLKIKAVVWVDDIFEKSSVLTDEELARHIAESKSSVDLCQNAGFSVTFMEFVAELVGVSSAQSLILQKLEDESEMSKANLSELIFADGAGSASDFTALQVAAFSEIFGDRLKTCSFTDWPNKIDELVVEKDTVFFVDLKNKHSGIGGKDVLEQLIAKKFQGLITLFTHECKMDGEIALLERIRIDLQPKKDDLLSTLRVGVISKQRCHPDNLGSRELGLAAPIYRLAMTTTFSFLAHAVATSLREGIDAGVELLAMLPITDIDRVVFQNSMKEGCSEIELVERLLFLTQREAVARSLKSSGELNALLAKARDSWITGEQKYVPKQISEKLTNLRSLEVFDTAELINLTHSPLMNGDIFEVCEGGKIKQYVLLMSPCDSMVRENGTRQLDTGFLVLISESDKRRDIQVAEEVVKIVDVSADVKNGAVSTSELVEAVSNVTSTLSAPDVAVAVSNLGAAEVVGKVADLEDQHGDTRLRFYGLPVNLEKDYKLDFVNSCPVVLDSLEWCVFNQDGVVRYNKDVTPALALLNGWEKRLTKLKNDRSLNKCGGEDQVPWPYRHLALKTKGFNSIHRVSIEKENGAVKKGFFLFNIKRVKRLRSPYADAALSAYLNYTGRPAFEHEFIR
jgi:hypothetical protein